MKKTYVKTKKAHGKIKKSRQNKENYTENTKSKYKETTTKPLNFRKY